MNTSMQGEQKKQRSEFGHCAIDVQYLNAQTHVDGAFRGMLLEFQILFDSCYAFGINPLPRLRKAAPICWHFSKTDEDISRSFVQGLAGHDFVWCCGLGVVAAQCSYGCHRPGILVVPPPEFKVRHDFEALQMDRFRNRAHTQMLKIVKISTLLGFNFQVVDLTP